MLDLNTASSLFEKKLQDFINQPNSPSTLYEPVNYILNAGGKRIRPSLMILAASSFNHNLDNIWEPALGIEVFHNFTLVHDDIMDNSDIRRNRETIHKKWDINRAILSGDVMMIQATQCFCNLPESMLAKVMKLFLLTAKQVCEGQQYDMDFEKEYKICMADYIKMIELKTAVLLATSLKIGAIIAGASEKDCNLLYNYGINIGLAFQLRDDYLDVYGNINDFGKELGKDIIARKKTAMLIKAFELADQNTKQEMLNWLSNQATDNKKLINYITNIYNKLNIPNIINNITNEYHIKALSAIDLLNVDEKSKDIYINIANSLINRNK